MPVKQTEAMRLQKKLANKAERLAGPSGLPKSKYMPDVPRQVHAHGGAVKKDKR